MDLNEVRELISLLESSQLSELEIEEEGRRIRLTKQRENLIATTAPAAVQGMVPAAPAKSAPREKTLADEGLVAVDSPMVGTFYRSPSPGEPSFVEPGDSVTPEQTICIVEAMKIMNEVAAKVAGTVERVLVENGEPVEFGQPLFAIRPA